jgi:hypothetical protein
MFLDKNIKGHVCQYAKQQHENLVPGQCGYKSLQVLKDWAGHYNHVHVRFWCPEHHACFNKKVLLGRGTGC